MADSTVCANFFPIIQAGEGDCVELDIQGEGGCDDPVIITPITQISQQEGNGAVCLSDGLYAVPEMLCYRTAFNKPSELCVTDQSCISYEYIPAGSTIEPTPPLLNVPPVGGNVELAMVDSGGNTLATAVITSSGTGVWSPSQVTIPGDAYVGVVVNSVGSIEPGCGLSQSALVCQDNSGFIGDGPAANGGSSGSGIVSVDALSTTPSCLTLQASGSGTSQNPRTVTGGLVIDPAPGNLLQCLSTGLRVDSLGNIQAPLRASAVVEQAKPTVSHHTTHRNMVEGNTVVDTKGIATVTNDSDVNFDYMGIFNVPITVGGSDAEGVISIEYKVGADSWKPLLSNSYGSTSVSGGASPIIFSLLPGETVSVDFRVNVDLDNEESVTVGAPSVSLFGYPQ